MQKKVFRLGSADGQYIFICSFSYTTRLYPFPTMSLKKDYFGGGSVNVPGSHTKFLVVCEPLTLTLCPISFSCLGKRQT